MNKKPKILIVENEIYIAMSIKMELEARGYEVYDYCTKGEDAIAFVQENIPDIIIMDIHLAGIIDGINAAKEIIAKIDIPIIFITGYEETDIFERAQKIKPLAYLIKPFQLSGLKPIIESIF